MHIFSIKVQPLSRIPSSFSVCFAVLASADPQRVLHAVSSLLRDPSQGVGVTTLTVQIETEAAARALAAATGRGAGSTGAGSAKRVSMHATLHARDSPYHLGASLGGHSADEHSHGHSHHDEHHEHGHSCGHAHDASTPACSSSSPTVHQHHQSISIGDGIPPATASLSRQSSSSSPVPSIGATPSRHRLSVTAPSGATPTAGRLSVVHSHASVSSSSATPQSDASVHSALTAFPPSSTRRASSGLGLAASASSPSPPPHASTLASASSSSSSAALPIFDFPSASIERLLDGHIVADDSSPTKQGNGGGDGGSVNASSPSVPAPSETLADVLSALGANANARPSHSFVFPTATVPARSASGSTGARSGPPQPTVWASAAAPAASGAVASSSAVAIVAPSPSDEVSSTATAMAVATHDAVVPAAAHDAAPAQ